MSATAPVEAGEIHHRAQPVSTSTYDDATRTVQVVAAAGAKVQRRSYLEGPYIEELGMGPENIDIGRFQGGAALLNAHQSWSMDDRLGAIVPGTVRVANGQLLATVKLSRNEGGERLAQDLRDGIGFSVSVGYRTLEALRIEGVDGALPTIRATRWEPFEISAVPIPADADARTRSLERNETLSQTTQTTQAAPVDNTRAIELERGRIAELGTIATRAGIADTELQTAIRAGTDVAAFRARAFDVLAERQAETASFPHQSTEAMSGIRSGVGESTKALTDYLMNRSSLSGNDIARDFLARSGVRQERLSDREVATMLLGGQRGLAGMHTTADFELFKQITGAAAAATLLEKLASSPSVLKRFSRERDARNFMPQAGYRLGEVPPLLKVGEHGEIKSGTMTEEKNLFSVETYARIFALTLQASVNDSLGAFSDFINNFAEAAISLEALQFYNMLLDNGFAGPQLSDGLPLFHGTHGNLGAASAISVASLGAAALAMRTQRNVGGTGVAGTAPKVLLVGPRLEVAARQAVAAVNAATSADFNPFSNLEVEVEDQFGAEFYGWFLIADPARRQPFIHGGIEGIDGPQVESRDGWRVLGTEYRVVHHFGCGINDFRAIFYNPGVAPA